MRNLKKILAMVLALVMSLSLMAAAGATDFKDDGDISDTYRQAIEVLSGLKVFNGDQNGNFNPEQSITRAEVAAIIYRITTGDVTGDGKDSYSVYSNQFTDVKDTDWFAGYVSYCHNAGYVKGHADHTFGPNDPVTGYQALAMILRAVGYDKNNEFVGDNWQINTASRATTEGVLDNVKGEPLGSEAARKLVAEILFRSILLQNVQWNIVKQDYDKLDTRVCDVLGLKEITGIVLANADADLDAEDDIHVGDTQTRLLVKEAKGANIAADTKVVLNITSDLEAIGEMRTAFVQKTANRNTYEPVVNTLYEAGSITADNNYQGTSVSVLDGVSVTNGTEKYIDYDPAEVTDYYSNGIRIRYVLGYVNKADADAQAKANPTVARVADSYVEQVTNTNKNQYPGQTVGNWVFDRVIHIDQILTEGDYDNLYYIFNNADKYNTPAGEMQKVQHGEVYVGTASVTDVSDTMKWSRFQEEYLKEDITRGLTIEPGNYVKVIDADDDGAADYALKREYYLDRVSGTYNDKVYYENVATGVGAAPKAGFASWANGSRSVDFGDAKVKDGDVILRNFIDGVWYGEIVEPKTVTIDKVDFQNKTVYDTEGNPYTASGIALATDMDYDIMAMSEKVEYNLYLDKGGYIRAYELAQGSQYALLTEMYPTGRNNGAFVTNDNWIVELMRVSDSYPAEYSLLNSYYAGGTMNEFIDDQRDDTPFNVNHNSVVANIYKDYLQQAIGHLNPTLGYTDSAAANKGTGDEFAWGTKANTSDNESWTNVGKYIMSENGANVSTAAELATRTGAQLYYAWVDLDGNGVVENGERFDVKGEKQNSIFDNDYRKAQKVTLTEWQAYVDSLRRTDATLAETNLLTALMAAPIGTYTVDGKSYPNLYPVYAVDYIKLDSESSIAAGAQHYTIAPTNTETFGHGDGTNNNWSYKNGAVSAANADSYGYLNNDYVNTVDTTEFYLVGENSIRTFTGFKNMPAIDKQSIRAAYAVAENTTADSNGNDYWVARVVVIELKGAYAFDSISLAYYNPYQQTAQVQALNTLNNESADPELEIRPQSLTWGAQWRAIGFYGLVGEVRNDGYSTSRDIAKIDGTTYKYNANKIFAGIIARKQSIVKGGGYFDIWTTADKDNNKAISLPNTVPFYFLSGSSVVGPVNIVDASISVGDEIIYVYNSAGQIAYAVDLRDGLGYNGAHYGMAALKGDWDKIMAEQAGQTLTVTFFGQNDGDNDKRIEVDYATAKANENRGLELPENATYTLTKVGGTQITKDAVKPEGKTTTYTLSIVNNGVIETWTLVQNGGRSDKNLYAEWLVGVTDGDGKFTAVNQDYKGSDFTTVENFLKTLSTKNGAEITKVTFVDGNGKDLPTTNTALSAVGYAKIVVTAENGDSQEYRINMGTNAIINGPFSALKNVLESTGLKLDIYQRGVTFFSSANDAYNNTDNDGWTVQPSGNGVAYDEAVAVMNALNAWLDTYNDGEFKDEFSVTLDSMNDDGTGPNGNVSTITTSGVAGHDGCRTEKTKSNVRICDTYGNEVTTIRVSVTWVTTICEPSDKAAKDAAAVLESNVFEIFVKTADKKATPAEADGAIYYTSEADLTADTAGTAGKTLYVALTELANAKLPNPYKLIGTALDSFDPHGSGDEPVSRAVTNAVSGDPTGAEFKFKVDMAYTDENGHDKWTAMGAGKFADDPFIFWKVTAK